MGLPLIVDLLGSLTEFLPDILAIFLLHRAQILLPHLVKHLQLPEGPVCILFLCKLLGPGNDLQFLLQVVFEVQVPELAIQMKEIIKVLHVVVVGIPHSVVFIPRNGTGSAPSLLQFFDAGKVPREVSDQTWQEFKEAVRTFNRNKNAFYKNQKKDQYENLEKKLALVQIAEDNKDSEDFKATTVLMKKIQEDWKAIGHVPRKDSDKVWKQFKSACNHYFDRLHASRNEENKEETEAFEKKKELLEALKNLEFTGDRKKDLPEIKKFIEEWKTLGKVPHSKRYIEGKFNKALDQAFERLDLDKTQTEMLKYENKVQALEEADDNRKIDNEHYFLTKKIEETRAEIRQLENNLQFFSNVDDKNPLVQEVHKNIQNHKDQLAIWQEKLEKIKTLY